MSSVIDERRDAVSAHRPRVGGAVRARAAALRGWVERLPADYRRGLGLTLGLYVLLYGALLVYTRGLPYVMDNNESFSAFVHASNLYHFPFSRTLGLTDEAFSPNEAAHPYVYTHQGNFPRVFAFVLYVLGARTIESQIVITTFTVGLLSIFLLYHYFATVGDALFAFIAAAVAMTDYIFFTQWQVNTFRVWHGLFFFVALVAVHGIEGTHRRRWIILIVATFACLFYFELVFAAFVAVMAGLYAGVRYYRRPRLVAWYWFAQSAGAAMAVMLLVGQLIGYLGWADFLEDLRLTYSSRNLIAEDPTYVERVREFVESRRIAFWYNFANVEYQRSPAEILSSITRSYFTVHTPILWYLVTIVTVGWLAGFGRRPQGGSPEAEARTEVQRHERVFPVAISAVLLIVSWTRFLLAVVQDGTLVGVAGPRLVVEVDEQPWVVVVAAAVAVALTVVAARTTTGRWWGLDRLPALQVGLAAGTLLLAEHLVLNSATLFDPFYLPLWSHVQQTWFPGGLVQVVIAAAGGVAVILSLNSWVRTETRWRSLASFLICGLLAYVVVYLLSPGYIQSGYLQRSSPFVSFVFQTAIALTVYAAWRVVAPWVACLARWRPASARVPQSTTPMLRGVRQPAFVFLFRLRSSKPFVAVHLRVPPFPTWWLPAALTQIYRFGTRTHAAGTRMSTAGSRGVMRLAAGACAVLLLALVLFPILFWIALQASHARLLPATHFGFIKQLARPPFVGASFAANTYAAPIYAYTGQWAYFDTRLALPDGGAVSLSEHGFVVNRDARSYLWLADRDLNEQYLHPDYFLCFWYQDLRTAVYRLSGISLGCSSAGIVQHASNQQPFSVADTIVARDLSPRDSWAIVKLDWTVLQRAVASDAGNRPQLPSPTRPVTPVRRGVR
jgi:hypothetical protein